MDFDFSTETITPDTTALLTIGGTGALEVPSGTTANRPSGPANGGLRYNSDINNIEGFVNSSWTTIATGTTTLTLTGDVTGTGAGSITTSLATVNASVGTFAVQTVNAKGLVTAATNLTGDATSSGSALTLATVNASIGTFTSVTVNAKGLVTAATDMTASGDATGSASGSVLALTLATVNASPQTDTFRKITVNGKGLVTATSTVSSGDITTALGYTPVNKVGDTMTGNLIMSGATVTGLPTPVNASDATPKGYVDSAVQGLSWKQSVKGATVASLTATYSNGTAGVGATLTGTGAMPVIDDVTYAVTDRILVKNQSTTFQNGIYVVTAIATNWVLTRAVDNDLPTEVDGSAVYVNTGTANAETGWTETATVATIGTDPVVWAQFSGSGAYAAGTGLTLTGNTFSLTSPVTTTLGGTGLSSIGTANQILGVNAGATGLEYKSVAAGTAISVTPSAGTLTIANTGVTSNVAGTGIGVSGATGAVTITNTGVTSAVAGTGIGVSGATGAVTFSNTGVTSITGTANQITASSSTGGVTLSLPGSVTLTTGLTISALTANSFLYSGTAGLLTTTTAPTDGQLLIGSTGAAPVAAALTAGTGISVTNGAGSISIANTGVTSVGLALPSIFTVSGSPVTTTGTLTGTLASQTANTVFVAPNGSAGAPTFRALAYADLPLSLYVENPSTPTAPTAAGANAIAFGSGTQATAVSSEAHGLQSIARVYGEVATSSGNFATIGDAQHGEYNMRIITSNNTVTEAFLDGAAARLVLPNNSSYMFVADIVCRRTDATGTAGAWTVSGLISRDASAATTAIIGAVSKTTIAKSPASLNVALTADTTNGSLKVDVTGVSAQTIRWSIYIRTQEVTN